MTEPAAHHRLVNRWSLSGEVVCETALHIGSSTTGDPFGGSDLPVARDGLNRPYIPGSSLRGVLRSGLESLLRGLGTGAIRVCDPFETESNHEDLSCSERTNKRRKGAKDEGNELTEARAFELAWQESCEICRLFGQLFLASRVRIADLPLTSDGADTYVRDGVGLDRDLRSAARGILYDFEAVPVGARFRLRMEIENAEPHEVGLLLSGLDLFGEGFLALGGKAARGLGLARVEGLELTKRSAEDFFQGTGAQPLPPDELESLRSAARTRYAEGGE